MHSAIMLLSIVLVMYLPPSPSNRQNGAGSMVYSVKCIQNYVGLIQCYMAVPLLGVWLVDGYGQKGGPNRLVVDERTSRKGTKCCLRRASMQMVK